MSEQYIYNFLRGGGLTRAGALGAMGNLGYESRFKPNNVEDRCPISDFDYTLNVDNHIIPKGEFVADSYGYGLAQWTYSTRKARLYELTVERGLSISDEAAQMELLLEELRNDFPKLYSFLCTTTDMYEATRRFCVDFENPLYPNVDARYQIACECANKP